MISVVDSPRDVERIEFRSTFRCTCPLTKEPDSYTVCISMEPNTRSLETNSLANYLSGFKDHELLAEEVAACIGMDMMGAAVPRSLTVTLDRDDMRDGIALRVVWRGR